MSGRERRKGDKKFICWERFLVGSVPLQDSIRLLVPSVKESTGTSCDSGLFIASSLYPSLLC